MPSTLSIDRVSWMTHVLTSLTPTEPWLAGEVRYLTRPNASDSGVESGIWRGTTADLPRTTSVRYDRDEYVFLIEGKVRLEVDDSEPFELSVGEAAAFSAGSTVRWTLLTDAIEEFFVYLPSVGAEDGSADDMPATNR